MDSLASEGYLDTDQDTLILRFQVRSPTFHQKSRDQQWYIQHLETQQQTLITQVNELRERLAIELSRQTSADDTSSNNNNINTPANAVGSVNDLTSLMLNSLENEQQEPTTIDLSPSSLNKDESVVNNDSLYKPLIRKLTKLSNFHRHHLYMQQQFRTQTRSINKNRNRSNSRRRAYSIEYHVKHKTNSKDDEEKIEIANSSSSSYSTENTTESSNENSSSLNNETTSIGSIDYTSIDEKDIDDETMFGENDIDNSIINDNGKRSIIKETLAIKDSACSAKIEKSKLRSKQIDFIQTILHKF